MSRDRSKYTKSFKTLGENIKTRREELNISQEELAFMITSARNYIGCIERGEKFPSVAMLLDISKALNCKLTDLVKNM